MSSNSIKLTIVVCVIGFLTGFIAVFMGTQVYFGIKDYENTKMENKDSNITITKSETIKFMKNNVTTTLVELDIKPDTPQYQWTQDINDLISDGYQVTIQATKKEKSAEEVNHIHKTEPNDLNSLSSKGVSVKQSFSGTLMTTPKGKAHFIMHNGDQEYNRLEQRRILAEELYEERKKEKANWAEYEKAHQLRLENNFIKAEARLKEKAGE